MAARPSALRVVAITSAVALVLALAAAWFYHPAVHLKVLTFLVLLAALPLGAVLHRVDRLIFLSPGLSRLSEMARTGLVVLAGILLAAIVVALGYLLAGT